MKSERIQAIQLGYAFGEAYHRATTPECIPTYSQKDLATLLTVPDIAFVMMNSDQVILWAIHNAVDETRLQAELAQVRSIRDDAQQRRVLANVTSVYLLQMSLIDIDPYTYFERVWRFCSGINITFEMTIRKISHILGWGSYRHALRHIGDTTQADVQVTIALYSIMKQENNLLKALSIVTAIPNNQDRIMRMIGALIVARSGIDAIPIGWRQDHLSLI
ncbi:MAG: hypothetical protein ACFE0Q_09440 [Anaerolineae bacterium]